MRRVLPEDLHPQVRRSLAPTIALRLIGNAGIRAPFPLLPAIADSTGLSNRTVGTILAVRDLTGLAAMPVGRVADRRGALPTVRISSFVIAAGLALSAAGPWGLAVGSVLFGLGKIAFDTAMNAWIGHTVRYENRARISGLAETSWALSGLLLIPLLAQVTDVVDWWAATLLMAVATLVIVPLLGPGATEAPAAVSTERQPRPRLDAPSLGAHGGLWLMSLSAQLVFITHGIWLDEAYGLEIGELGAAAAGLGALELLASSTSSAATDRFGKQRSAGVGLALLVIGVGALAALGTPALWIALALIGVAILGFEFAIVSMLPLIAELDPDARAASIGIGLGGATLLRSVGSFGGVWLLESSSMTAVLIAATVVGLAATALVLVVAEEPTSEVPTAEVPV